MSKLEQLDNQQLKSDWMELVALYNRLDHEQRAEFRNKLAKLNKQPVLAQQIENCLANLSEDDLERMLIYTKLLLVS
jgi:replicative DNA helicase